MALQKQPISLNFAQGLDTKSDPKQVPLGKFRALQNMVFGKDKLLQKRNGFGELPSLPTTDATYLTTLNGNLTAVGTNIQAYSSSYASWVSKGSIQPMKVNVLPLIRNNYTSAAVDTAVSANGLVCTVTTATADGGSSYGYTYSVADAVTGQNIVAPTGIPGGGGIDGSSRVFVLGNYFVIVFTTLITAVHHLKYIAISTTNPAVHTSPIDIAAAYIPATTLSWDGVVTGTTLYVGYNTTAGGQSIKITSLTANQAGSGSSPATPITYAGAICTMMSMCVDNTVPSTPIIYAAYYDAGSSVGKVLAVDQNLNNRMSPTSVITSGTVLNVAAAAISGVCSIYYEVSNNYTYDTIPSHYIASRAVTLPATVTTGSVSPAAGSAATGTVRIRSVGLASKAFIIDSVPYFLTAYQSPYQPTYFLVDGTTTAAAPKVVAKLAYQNGGGYLTLGLPSVTVTDNVAQIPYLYKDLITSVNKNTNVAAGTQVAGIYAQLGINLATFTIGTEAITSAEIASDLHVSGGLLWMYDGYLPVEHNFLVYPDSVEATWSATGGAIVAKPDGTTNTNAYFYQAVYEWCDNQGNIHRSAPSIPIGVTTSGSGTAGSITVNVPYLRLTYKTANPVKITIYRWSVAQQVYYQVTSILTPQLNSTTSDSLAFVDTLADASIIGNEIIYVNGGVVENTAAPATNLMTLFDTRLWTVSAEDPNLLNFSKQVIETTPVEMSDLFSLYVAPTTGVQGSTGPTTAISAMDDKLIIFKKDAIYYVNGSGPDNTGANNQYSQPIFITSAVGCDNQASVVLMQNGLMFQSDKGIWLLGRDLSTHYIGAPVEAYNDAIVKSVVNVPKTTQVRFTMDTGITLVYDYYYDQWGTFNGVPGISSCIYQGLHTYLNQYSMIFQETPGLYMDGSNPVLLSFTTSWINIAGLQGYERLYFMYLLGTYYTPFMLNVLLRYDYNDSATQNIRVTPDNYGGNWGSEAQWGSGGPYGGPGNTFEARIFPQLQKCESFQITIDEYFDPSIGVPAGQGLSLSGLDMVVGVKKGYRTQKAAKSFG